MDLQSIFESIFNTVIVWFQDLSAKDVGIADLFKEFLDTVIQGILDA